MFWKTVILFLSGTSKELQASDEIKKSYLGG